MKEKIWSEIRQFLPKNLKGLDRCEFSIEILKSNEGSTVKCKKLNQSGKKTLVRPLNREELQDLKQVKKIKEFLEEIL
jgi:hypothetical protein